MNKYSKIGNFKIVNGNIQSSIVDMDSKKITSVGDPTQLYDAVNLKTLNAAISTPSTSIYEIDISLVGTIPISIPFLGNVGNYDIHVEFNPNPTNGPIFNAKLIKNRASSNGFIHSFGGEIGIGSSEIIYATWTSNGFIFIKKQGGSVYDGSYHVKVVIN